MHSNGGIYYNYKVYHYANGKQIRLYNKPLCKGSIKENANEDYEKNYFNENKQNKENKGNEEEQLEEYRKNLSIQSSMNRSVQSVYGIARANKWDWFLTITFDPKKVDSSNYEEVTRITSQWLKNLKKRVCPNMKYLLVPELHSDGIKWHMHGLLADCSELQLVDSGIVNNGKIVYNLNNWKYGFSTVTAVEDTGRVSSYIVKYITKTLCEQSKGKKRFWASKNCLRLEDVEEHGLYTENEMEEIMKKISESEDVQYIKTLKNANSGRIVTYIEIGLDE